MTGNPINRSIELDDLTYQRIVTLKMELSRRSSASDLTVDQLIGQLVERGLQSMERELDWR